MVKADGKIDNDEIAMAEGIGMKLFSDFDSAEFREYFNGEIETAQVTDLADLLKETLDNEAKGQIYSYLQLIASADGEVSSEEEQLLNDIAGAMGFVPTDNTTASQDVVNK